MRQQVALVTGGASGIGRALAQALTSRGHVAVLADVDGTAARAAAAELTESVAPGGDASAVTLDVTDRDAFRDVVEDVVRTHGRLDLLFNNAGIGVGGLVDELDDEHWDRCLAVNLHGVVHGVQAAVPVMTAQGRGHIVNTASMAGLMTTPMMLPYTTTKHAVVALSRALRSELKPVGVGVTAVCPAFIATPLLDNLNPGMAPTAATSGVRQLAATLQPGGLPGPEPLADAVLHAVARNKPLVVFPKGQWAVVAAQRWAPSLVHAAVDQQVRRYRARRRP
jgi:NAD(P)-dependent dehydrogenase (short-subunit alcohol dehydrogenase family)